MSGQNNGTGRPLWFRCSQCRRRRTAGLYCGTLVRVKLTGRQRSAGGNCGQRNANKLREYVCHDCGHVGWSRHVDLERLERLERGGE